MIKKLLDAKEAARAKAELKADLEELMTDPRFQRFFNTFLRHAGVLRTQFSNDPYEIVAQEATRRLAMSYLNLIGKEDANELLRLIENDQVSTNEYQKD